jgi:serine/threonine-protein kinase
MARSGGFNVPADYFRSSGMPAPVPASPAGRPARWPLFAVIAAVGTIVGIVAVVLTTRSNAGGAHATPSSTVPAAVTTTAPTPPASTATLAPPPSVAPVMHEVLISVIPTDATLTRDGKDLGSSPVALHLAEGESATVLVAHKGFKTKTVTIDGNDAKVAVTMESVFGPPPRAGAGGGAPKPTGGGIDDVGDPFAKKH